MKKLCIVHIGMPKTGSTSLQLSFLRGFKDDDYRYANLSNQNAINHNGIIYNLFSQYADKHYHNVSLGRDKEQIKLINDRNLVLLVDGFLNTPANVEVISGEDIYHLEDTGVVKLHEFLKKYFHKILIIGYVRPPISFMASAFQELVKLGFSKIDFKSIYHPYKNFLRFDNVFGRDNVYLWKFDPTIFPDGNIVLDFATRLGIKLNVTTGIQENTAISQESLSILFVYNKYRNDNKLGYTTLRTNLMNATSNIGKTRFQFSSRLTQSVLQQHTDDYNWIKQRMSENMEENITGIGIDSEEELLEFSVTTIPALKQLVGEEYLPPDAEEKTPLYVAKLVQALTAQLKDN